MSGARSAAAAINKQMSQSANLGASSHSLSSKAEESAAAPVVEEEEILSPLQRHGSQGDIPQSSETPRKASLAFSFMDGDQAESEAAAVDEIVSEVPDEKIEEEAKDDSADEKIEEMPEAKIGGTTQDAVAFLATVASAPKTETEEYIDDDYEMVEPDQVENPSYAASVQEVVLDEEAEDYEKPSKDMSLLVTMLETLPDLPDQPEDQSLYQNAGQRNLRPLVYFASTAGALYGGFLGLMFGAGVGMGVRMCGLFVHIYLRILALSASLLAIPVHLVTIAASFTAAWLHVAVDGSPATERLHFK